MWLAAHAPLCTEAHRTVAAIRDGRTRAEGEGEPESFRACVWPTNVSGGGRLVVARVAVDAATASATTAALIVLVNATGLRYFPNRRPIVIATLASALRAVCSRV